MKNLGKEIEDIKKNQIKFLELKKCNNWNNSMDELSIAEWKDREKNQ